MILGVVLYAENISIDALLTKAESENKVAVVFIESDNCPWCKRMKEKTFTHKKVQELLQNELVFGIYDVNDKQLPNHMRARTTPTVQLVSGKGEVLMTVVGFEPAGPFIKHIEEAQAKLKSGN